MRKKGRHLSVAFETNLFKAAIFPFKFCTSLIVFGGSNSIMARIFSGLTSIPLWDTMKPKNFPTVTLNATCLDLASCYMTEGCQRFPGGSLGDHFRACSSLAYHQHKLMFLPIWCVNILFINLWYVAPAFLSPNDITLKWNSPWLVTKEVFS